MSELLLGLTQRRFTTSYIDIYILCSPAAARNYGVKSHWLTGYNKHLIIYLNIIVMNKYFDKLLIVSYIYRITKIRKNKRRIKEE